MLLFGIFGQAMGVALNPAELRPVSQAELQEQSARFYLSLRPATAKDQLYRLLQEANYRPPVHVPEGWAAWYACGDEAR